MKVLVQYNIMCILFIIPIGVIIPLFENKLVSFLLFACIVVYFYSVFICILIHCELKQSFEKNKLKYFTGIYCGSLGIGLILISFFTSQSNETFISSVTSINIMLVGLLMIIASSIEMLEKFSIFGLNNYVKVKNMYYLKTLSNNEQYINLIKPWNFKNDIKAVLAR